MAAGESAGFGELVRRYRTAACLTQEELAERAGLSVRGLSDLERGMHHRPQTETARCLAQALDLPEVDRAALLAARGRPTRRKAGGIADVRGYAGFNVVDARRAQIAPPLPLTSFVGRQSEVAEVRRLLVRTRLLTLTGGGGVGKTRLALHLADELLADHPDGVCLAELGAADAPSLVPQVVSLAVGVREQPGRILMVTLTEALALRRCLLVLDNCEHLIEACASLAERLLQTCPHVRILATSREPLGVPGEVAWRVPSLSLSSRRNGEGQGGGSEEVAAVPPSRISVQSSSEAVQLFAERAAAALPGFTLDERNLAAVAEICRRLDGIPLAIELAATRVPVLLPNEIAARLDDRFRLLVGGNRTAPPRQRTLQATVDWSYNLLDGREQCLFDRLSVFRGSFTLAAAETVCAGEAPSGLTRGIGSGAVLDLVAHLVDKSLVLADRLGEAHETRYRLLETLRAYGWERLDAHGEAGRLQWSHAAWVLELAERAERAFHGPEEARWLQRLVREHDNMRTALAWLIDRAEADSSLRLAGALGWFEGVRGAWNEGRAWLEQSLAVPGAAAPTLARAKALAAAGRVATFQGDFVAARPWLEESATLGRQLGDGASVLAARGALVGLLQFTGQIAAAEGLAEEMLALARRLGEAWWEGRMLAFQAQAFLRRGDRSAASARLGEAMLLARRTGDAWSLAMALAELGDVERARGAYARAGAFYEESLALREGLGLFGLNPSLLHNLGYVALAEGECSRAASYFAESIAQFKRLGDRRGLAECLLGLASVACAENRAEDAAHLFGAGEGTLEALGAQLWPSNRADYERGVAIARVALDAEAFETAWLAGRGISLEQAVGLALARPSAASPATSR